MDRVLFFRTLASLENQRFKKVAETLLLYFYDNSIEEADQTHTIHRAYQHYIVNTDGPLRDEGKDTFDVSEWAREYAAAFDITLTETSNETLMIIDDRDKPVRDKTWGRLEGQSSASSLREIARKINLCRYGRDDVIPSRLFRFDPHPKAYNKSNAIWLADLAQLVYLKESYVRGQLKLWGFEPVRWIEDKSTDTQAFVAAKMDYAVVSFRGTKGFKDLLTDLSFRKEPFHGGALEKQPVGRVHRGFVTAFESVWAAVLAAVNELGPNRRISSPATVLARPLLNWRPCVWSGIANQWLQCMFMGLRVLAIMISAMLTILS
jgi:Lipase (class 3)